MKIAIEDASLSGEKSFVQTPVFFQTVQIGSFNQQNSNRIRNGIQDSPDFSFRIESTIPFLLNSLSIGGGLSLFLCKPINPEICI